MCFGNFWSEKTKRNSLFGCISRCQSVICHLAMFGNSFLAVFVLREKNKIRVIPTLFLQYVLDSSIGRSFIWSSFSITDPRASLSLLANKGALSKKQNNQDCNISDNLGLTKVRRRYFLNGTWDVFRRVLPIRTLLQKDSFQMDFLNISVKNLPLSANVSL